MRFRRTVLVLCPKVARNTVLCLYRSLSCTLKNASTRSANLSHNITFGSKSGILSIKKIAMITALCCTLQIITKKIHSESSSPKVVSVYLISYIVIAHVLYYDTTLFNVKPKNTVKVCIRVSVGVSTAYLYV